MQKVAVTSADLTRLRGHVIVSKILKLRPSDIKKTGYFEQKPFIFLMKQTLYF